MLCQLSNCRPIFFLFRPVLLTAQTVQCNTKHHYSWTHSSPTKLYDVLGVSPKATHSDIKAAFYAKSKLLHPDVNSADDATKKFHQLTNAYEILGNIQRRRMYDRGLVQPSVMDQEDSMSRRGDDWWRQGERFRQSSRFGQRRPGAQPPPSGRRPHFDYEEHFRMHYGGHPFQYHSNYESILEEMRREQFMAAVRRRQQERARQQFHKDRKIVADWPFFWFISIMTAYILSDVM